MINKVLEIRDSMTYIPVLCVQMQPDNQAQYYHFRRCGYPCDGSVSLAITQLRADGDPFTNDPYGWPGGTRTMQVAHNYIYENWAELKDGDVVDVEFILKETLQPKISERFER